jgi:hypothetical protein
MGKSLHIRILHADSTELNRKIRRFDAYYNRFLELYADHFFRHIEPHVYDSLVNILFQYCPYDAHAIDFYSIYAKYRYAALDLMYRNKEKQLLYKKHLNNEYVFYKNDAYMEFFNDFFENYLYAGTNKLTRQMLFEHINHKADYFKLLDDMGKDPLLVNEKIREMVLIKGLGELYADFAEFNRTNIMQILRTMQQYTKFEEHKILIGNMLLHFFYLKSGTKAPDFSLKDVYNANIKLSDFKGKYVYMHFFATYSEESIRDMIILKSLHDQYKDTVHFISIMVDFEPVKLYHFVSTYRQFDWTFLQVGDNFTFLDDYRVKALPLGVLIDTQGNIVQYPAVSPTKGLFAYFFNLFPAIQKPSSLPNK